MQIYSLSNHILTAHIMQVSGPQLNKRKRFTNFEEILFKYKISIFRFAFHYTELITGF